MQVSELTSVFNDESQNIIICDLGKNAEYVYEGPIDKLPSDYDSQHIYYVDNISNDTLIININTSP